MAAELARVRRQVWIKRGAAMAILAVVVAIPWARFHARERALTAEATVLGPASPLRPVADALIRGLLARDFQSVEPYLTGDLSLDAQRELAYDFPAKPEEAVSLATALKLPSGVGLEPSGPIIMTIERGSSGGVGPSAPARRTNLTEAVVRATYAVAMPPGGPPGRLSVEDRLS
ncbi:MAG: hypothetical protein ACYC6I_07930, partial [Bacillota bacterium]